MARCFGSSIRTGLTRGLGVPFLRGLSRLGFNGVRLIIFAASRN
jgi:hypothetical protein